MVFVRLKYVLLFVCLILLAGCVPAATESAPTASLLPTIALPSATPSPTATTTATQTATPSPSPSPTPSPTPTLTPTPTPAVLIGAGDIAFCGQDPPYQADEKTAALVLDLLEDYPQAVVFTSGDNVYGEGRAVEFRNCFEPSWGQFKERIRPVPGNHDYMTDQAAPYYAYFGEAAGPAGLGYYSYDQPGWHIVGLNSNCNDIACGPNSRQAAWLAEDLQNSAAQCSILYWHHPRWSSGLAGGSGSVSTFWRTAYQHGAEIVINGHDHNYERFAPQDADGQYHPQGVRQFVVGTGGAMLRAWGEVKPNSEVRHNQTHGVLLLKLYPGRYEWQFIPTDDPSLGDSGAGECH